MSRYLPKICVVVPAYNEEQNIVSTIESLYDENPSWHIVVIDDGSNDRTASLARQTNKAQVVSLALNLGIGGGVQTGFKYAHRNGFDIVVQFDGDGQHIASEISKIIDPIVNGKSDVVIGSRFLDGSGQGFQSTQVRRFGIKIFSCLNSLLVNQRITDNTSGFRAYNSESVRFLSEEYPVDYPEPEAVILLGKNQFRLSEIPVQMKERLGGVSSISGWRSAYYMVKVLLAIIITYSRASTRTGETCA